MVEEQTVILVDTQDTPLGLMEKMEAHQKGLLHRAFSGFVFNEDGSLLLQRRAPGKYHNPGIWANTVCSHPRAGESVVDAARRRLAEELGFSADFREVGTFIYQAAFPNGLIEHEFDHVCTARWNGQMPHPDPDEVCAIRWVPLPLLAKEIAAEPERFSVWLREIIRRFPDLPAPPS
jgi:isopentenyl-diphosphate delta-isomerase